MAEDTPAFTVHATVRAEASADVSFRGPPQRLQALLRRLRRERFETLPPLATLSVQYEGAGGTQVITNDEELAAAVAANGTALQLTIVVGADRAFTLPPARKAQPGAAQGAGAKKKKKRARAAKAALTEEELEQRYGEDADALVADFPHLDDRLRLLRMLSKRSPAQARAIAERHLQQESELGSLYGAQAEAIIAAHPDARLRRRMVLNALKRHDGDDAAAVEDLLRRGRRRGRRGGKRGAAEEEGGDDDDEGAVPRRTADE